MPDPGKYIVFEGLDGCGKTTQQRKTLDMLGGQSIGVREPGGTPVAEQIRTLIKDADISRSPATNLYLFSAARRSLIEEVVRPAITEGRHVIADRNWFSTLAYQSVEHPGHIKDILTLSKLATQEFFQPDLLILIDTSVDTCQQRLKTRGQATDYFEAKGTAYFTAVRHAYLTHINHFKNAVVINGEQPIHQVWAEIQPLLAVPKKQAS